MKSISNSTEELHYKFETLFKQYEEAGSSHVHFEELQNIFYELKDAKLKLILALDELSKASN